MAKFKWIGRKGTESAPDWVKTSDKDFDTQDEAYLDMKKAFLDVLSELIGTGTDKMTYRGSNSSKRLGIYIAGVNYTFKIEEIKE